MAKILFCEPVSLENLKPFQETKHEIFFPKESLANVHEFDRSALIQTIKDLRPDVLVVGLKFVIDQEIIDLGIKLVATRTTGLDHITGKVEVLSLRGEDLSDITATAEWTFLNMGMLLRKTGHELNGKKLGIIGYGRIGKMMAQYAEAFKMNVLAYDSQFHHFNGQAKQDYLKKVLSESDIVSLNITSDESNRGFMDLEKFKMMKEGAYFLNSARPWLVSDDALLWALDNKLSGCWTDFDLPFERPNLITTPHLGGKTIESSMKTEFIICAKILEYAKGNL